MSPVSRFSLLFCGILALAARPAPSKGITVRFLPNPPEDSVVTYQVMRADGRGQAPVWVGNVPAATGRDTFSFADTSALKGRPYLYSIIGLDAVGGASVPSESTEVAQPFLALPDTLQLGVRGARFTLATGADPLSGSVPLSLSLEDSSRFSLRYDSAAGQFVISARSQAGEGRVTVRAAYFGKFTDTKSVWLGAGATALRPAPEAFAVSRAWEVPATWSPGSGWLRIRSGRASPATGPALSWSVWAVAGGEVATLALPPQKPEVAWDGNDRLGRPARPARYFWAVRGPGGALLGSGTLRILP